MNFQIFKSLLSGNHLLIPYRELASNIGMLFYNTLSATRKILRRRFSFVEKVTPVFYIPRRGLTILCNTGKIKFFPRTVVIFKLANCHIYQLTLFLYFFNFPWILPTIKYRHYPNNIFVNTINDFVIAFNDKTIIERSSGQQEFFCAN